MDRTPDQMADDAGRRWDASLFARQLGVLGERTWTARKSREWSQQDLADRTGMGRPSVSGIEGGKQNITLEVLWRLASGLQVHWADLLDDRKADLPPPHTESSPFNAQLRAFGTSVYETRFFQRLSQQALTARTRIDRSTISKIELGTQNIKLETLSRLASGLHAHWADLLDDRQPAGRPRPPNGGAMTTDDPVVTELQAICEVCLQPIDDGQGAVWVRPPAKPTRTPSERADWHVTHDDCAQTGVGYRISVERIRTWAAYLHWTGHLMSKDWLADTTWSHLIMDSLNPVSTTTGGIRPLALRDLGHRNVGD